MPFFSLFIPLFYIIFKYYSNNIPIIKMPRISVEVPQEILDDLRVHIGDNKKFVNLSDAVRTACRKLLDQLDEIDKRHGRVKEK